MRYRCAVTFFTGGPRSLDRQSAGRRRLARAAGLAFAFTFTFTFAFTFAFVAAAAAGSARAAAPAAHGHTPPITGSSSKPSSRSSSNKAPAAVRFECPEALDDGTLIDERQAGVLAALAVGAKWLVGDPPAADLRPRGVRLFCGPDLDGDGDRESLVELSYPDAGSDDDATSSDGAGTAYALLVSRHGQAWRAIAGLAVDLGGGPEAGRGATFVRRPGGRWGVEARRSSGGSAHDCRIAGYEIFELQAGGLRSVKAGDRSLTCLPCGCDNP